MARTHQEHSEALWNKLSQKFASKDDVLNSTLVKQGWKLVESVVGNNTITLPSIDTVTEIYIEMYDTDGTIVHHTDLRKESLQFESTNTSTREIVLDNMHDTQTYVTYSLENNTITPSCYEGVVLDGESTNVTTVVYIKELLEMAVTDLQANNIQYDNSVSGTDASNVQSVLDEHISNSVLSENGAHGFRYFEGRMQAHIYDEESMTLKWVNIPYVTDIEDVLYFKKGESITVPDTVICSGTFASNSKFYFSIPLAKNLKNITNVNILSIDKLFIRTVSREFSTVNVNEEYTFIFYLWENILNVEMIPLQIPSDVPTGTPVTVAGIFNFTFI